MKGLRPLSQRERVLVTLSLSVVLALSLYVLVLEPLAMRWTGLRAQGLTLTSETEKLRHLMANRDEIESGFNQIEGAIPTGASTEQLQLAFMKEVDTLATRTGLNVTNLKPLRSKQEGRFERLSLEIKLAGEHQQLIKLLQTMQRRDRLLRGDRIALLAGRGQAPIEATLTISKLVRIRDASSRIRDASSRIRDASSRIRDASSRIRAAAV